MNLKHLFMISMCIYLFTGCSYKSMEENIDMSDNSINSTFRSASLEKTINQKDSKYKKYNNTTNTQAKK